MLRGRKKLRVLELEDIDDCYNVIPESVRAIPLSIECLRIRPAPDDDESAFNQSLQIIGDLPVIKKLDLFSIFPNHLPG